MWYGTKKYGQSKENLCPFCDKIATVTNKQKIPVCPKHTAEEITGWKCACGRPLDGPYVSKYGPFFACPSCGNVNFKKASEIQQLVNDPNKKYKIQKTYDDPLKGL
jgi:predicted RNA-binding Zn-ribbon protein involved in translation (DUF1610 family)